MKNRIFIEYFSFEKTKLMITNGNFINRMKRKSYE